MISYMGTSASGGLAVGKIKVINRRITGFKRVVLATHREKALFEAALILAKDELRRLMTNGERTHQDILNFQLVTMLAKMDGAASDRMSERTGRVSISSRFSSGVCSGGTMRSLKLFMATSISVSRAPRQFVPQGAIGETGLPSPFAPLCH